MANTWYTERARISCLSKRNRKCLLIYTQRECEIDLRL